MDAKNRLKFRFRDSKTDRRHLRRGRKLKLFGKSKIDRACKALLEGDCYGFFEAIESERELVWFMGRTNAWLIPVAKADYGFFRELKLRDALDMYVNYNECEAYHAACYIGSFGVMNLFEPLLGNCADVTKRYNSEKEMLADINKTKKLFEKRLGISKKGSYICSGKAGNRVLLKDNK